MCSSPPRGPRLPGQCSAHTPPGAERAGLPKVRFQDLRHIFAALALQNGVDVKTVSGIPGRFSAGFTLDTYAHVTTDAQRPAANVMGNLLSSSF